MGPTQTGGRPAEPATLCLKRTPVPANCQGTTFEIFREFEAWRRRLPHRSAAFGRSVRFGWGSWSPPVV